MTWELFAILALGAIGAWQAFLLVMYKKTMRLLISACKQLDADSEELVKVVNQIGAALKDGGMQDAHDLMGAMLREAFNKKE